MRLKDPNTGFVTKEYSKLGPKVTECPPLLDPTLSFEEAKEQHQAYINNGSSETNQLLKEVKERENVDERQAIMFQLCEQYPAVLPFIPTQQVMQKMIFKAVELKTPEDILEKINPKERKRIKDEQDLEEEIYMPYCELRVLPTQIEYPDIENNWPGFFKETSLMHLAEKYKPFDMR
jgi:hypothetical protein